MNKLTIGWLYPDLLNLYGDKGNIECLINRCMWRGIRSTVVKISLKTKLTASVVKPINLLFMGGGPDSSQVKLYEDFTKNKRSFIKEHIDHGYPSLFICGGYQLLGKYYKPFQGSAIEGLSVFDMYTEHFGRDKFRCVGNIVVDISSQPFGGQGLKRIVGFENHGGRTYLGEKAVPLGTVVSGYGNNGEDKTEGVVFKNTFGTYLHGPVLPKNPHFADYLISKALKTTPPSLDDTLEVLTHRNSLNLGR